MKIFFDTEFTQLRQDTTLISIGLISEDNRKFYAEFNDYNKELVDEWISKNVLPHMITTKVRIAKKRGKEVFIPPYFVYGSKEFIREKLYKWLKSFGEDIELVSDVCHYDMVLFISIFGTTAFGLPEFICPVCHDINQDIARFYKISQREAFNISREKIVNKSENAKHNALVDAMIIKQIYEKIKRETII